MMDSEVQKTAPRYVLATPGHREGTRVRTATFPVPERFLCDSTEHCAFLMGIISPRSDMHPTRQVLLSLFYK